MTAFVNLDDSPMFHKEVCSLEQAANELKDRCQSLFKGGKLFMASLGEACNADNTFADSLEAFGGGQDDPVSVSIGGPVISKFINAFRELATYKEFLRSQVDHVLVDRLVQFVDADLQDAKDSRKRFDKALHAYDQSRERFASLKKSTRGDVVEELEENLQNSKSAFEQSRFNLVHALMNIETKKKYEFLDSISAVMDAHLRYFKLGYELFRQMEPYIHQVLAYAQQSKERANIEQDKLAKRIQEFRTQAELDSLRASSFLEPSTTVDGIHVIGTSSYRNIEAIMQSSTKGVVQTIKQGYLLKRSSSLRGDWKRRFFVLSNQGTLNFYKNKDTKSMGFQYNSTASAENNSGVFSRFRSKHSRSLSVGEGNLDYQVVDLRTAMLKMDAEDADLRLCFRIITPTRTFTLQAENGAERTDWVNKITGVIASILNTHIFQQPFQGTKHLENVESAGGALCCALRLDHNQADDYMKDEQFDSALKVVREIPGNDLCAECSTPEPDWASLNLGILLCIECSGVHRNLGVHISKVRSLTLDVKVWESTILDLFHALGNAYCNSVWEGLLLLTNDRVQESNITIPSITKPCPKDTISEKEKYIHAKYVDKLLMMQDPSVSGSSKASSIWQAVKENNLREVYSLIVTSDANIVNTTSSEATGVELHDHVDDTLDSQVYSPSAERKPVDPAACEKIKISDDPENCLQGCSLLHLACHVGNAVMVELLLQFGADVNYTDFHGRTPLHHCISRRNYSLAKFLLRRGALASIKDGGGLSVLERAMEMGAITDEELFIKLTGSS